jgi:hypothetical protein
LKITLIGRKTKPFISGLDTPMKLIDPCESKKKLIFVKKLTKLPTVKVSKRL